MEKISVFIVLLICAANIYCVPRKMENSAAVIEIKNIEGHYVNDEDYTNTAIE